MLSLKLILSALLLKMTASHKENNSNILPIFTYDYFLLKNINSIKIFCCSKKESFKFFQQFRISNSIKIVNVNENHNFDDAMLGGDYNKVGVYMNLDCKEHYKNMLQKNIAKYTNSSYNWLFWSESYTKTIKFFRALPLRWDSQVTLATPGVFLFDLHKPDVNERLLTTKYAEWNRKESFVYVKEIDKTDLKGITVKGMISLHQKPIFTKYSLKKKDKDYPDDNMMKFSFIVHDYLRKYYNFRWNIHYTDTSDVGMIYGKNGNELDYYSGGQFLALEYKRADIGLYPGEKLSMGLKKFNFLPLLTKFRQCFVFFHPHVFSKPGDLLLPFSVPAWLVLLGLTVLTTLILRLITYFSKNDEKSTAINLLLVIGSLAQQGLTVTSDRVSNRIVHLAILILSILGYCFYNAAIVILLLSPTARKINSVETLLDNQMLLGSEDTPYNRFHLSKNYSSEGGRVYEERIKGNFYNLSYGVDLIKQSYAFFGHDSNIYSLIEKSYSDPERCSLGEVMVHRSFDVSTFVRKDLPYKELLIRGLLLLKETGIISRENKYWNPQRPPCLGQEPFNVVNFKSAYLTYIIYGFGFFASLALLALEISWTKWKQHSQMIKVIKIQ